MRYLENFLSDATLRTLAADVLQAYNPQVNAIDLSHSCVIDEIRQSLEPIVQRPLRYFGAFLLLVSHTTIETATKNVSEGWHVDSSCAHVSGDCYNTWIPLYNSSTNTGIQVIAQADNSEIYRHMGDATLPLEILVRTSAQEVFERLDATDADLVLLRRDGSRSLVLNWSDVAICSRNNPCVGDVALFKQTEIHRGFHQNGIRIQLSVKFMDADAKEIHAQAPQTPMPKPLTKHGRLEAQLVRELLGISVLRASSRPGIDNQALIPPVAGSAGPSSSDVLYGGMPGEAGQAPEPQGSSGSKKGAGS